MKNTPLKNYGFNYKHNDKEFAFHVTAYTEEEARDRVSEMGKATFIGELIETPNVEITGRGVENED